MNVIDTQRSNRKLLEDEITDAGGEIRRNAVKCPWHDDRHASGSIWCDQQGVWRYKCHVCDVHGDVFDLRAKNTGQSLADVLRQADGRPRPAKTQAASSQIPKRAVASLADLRLAVAQQGEIEAEYTYRDPKTKQPQLVVFRLQTKRGKSFRQCHPSAKGWVMQAPPKPWPLYRRDVVSGAERVFVVEGERCADALIALGFPATTSACGAGKSAHTDWTPLAGKNVILWPDCDEAGRWHMKDVACILARLEPRSQVSIIEPHELDLSGKEDVLDFVKQCHVLSIEPQQAIRLAVDKAHPAGPIADYRRRLVRIEAGELACLPLPWPELARLTWLAGPGRLAVIAGRQGAAKSFFGLQLLRYWLDSGISVSAYFLEGDLSDLLDRCLAQVCGMGEVTNLDWQKANAEQMKELTVEHQAEIDRLAVAATVSASLGLETLEDLAAWFEREAKMGRRAILIDPVSAATRTAQPWVSDTEFVRRIKRAALEHECTAVLVTHLVKGAEEGKPDKVAGAAAYARFSDTVLQVMRHDKKTSKVRTPVGQTEIEHKQTIYIEKARAPGTGFRLAYDLTSGLTFEEHGLIVKKRKGSKNGW